MDTGRPRTVYTLYTFYTDKKPTDKKPRLHPMRQIEMNTGVTFFMVFMFFMVNCV